MATNNDPAAREMILRAAVKGARKVHSEEEVRRIVESELNKRRATKVKHEVR